MGIGTLFQTLCLAEIRRLLTMIGLAVFAIVLLQCSVLPYWKRGFPSSSDEDVAEVIMISNATFSNDSKSSGVHVFNVVANYMHPSHLEEEGEDETETEDMNLDYYSTPEKNADDEITLKMGVTPGERSIMGYSTRAKAIELEQVENVENVEKTFGEVQNGAGVQSVASLGPSANYGKNVPVILNKNSSMAGISMLKRWAKQSISITQMNSLLLQSLVSHHSLRPRWSSTRDRELLSAKLGILNAPVLRDTPGLHASVFRNISMFKRSYELMERMLKVYIYKEGEKPVFHQSKMRGIYASEGWFMKLIEGNKKFVVRDPRKAHLFYLPFSPHMLRTMLYNKNISNQKALEEYLKNYVDLVARKYRFWNRTGGADHFLVGCHDWASRITRHHMNNCIRALCNANVAKDFRIGKDTSLPVTYIRSAESPQKDLGGKPPSERPILAFFAGGMHGYLRPILLQYWENKEPEMKIFGQLSRDLEGKRVYREYMKSSKYCICARGYEVHTPRVVEAIFYECVPVIISDNYVPPFFEALNWGAFSVFVQEKNIPNLRNILLSIPEEKYLVMQSRVKMVQQHFLWHKKPLKYDLFHMILHSIWHNRVFQMNR